MAKITIYESADRYSDGDIENEILALASQGFDITKDGGSYPYAVAYHFSPERENILSWYPFKDGASCLEIGAGCGAITGMLCKKCTSVVSVDISERRSKINFARHKNEDGLEIIACNIQQLALDRRFDYVVLNGVFEYALSFIHTDTPYLTLLDIAKGFLAPGGKIFIAIENRLGLKYFNGAPEDHTDSYFLGLNGYSGNNSVRTFSRSELIRLIEEAGFSEYRFYYPYPDYKFPSEIYADSTVNGGSFGAPYMNLNKRSFGLFSEQKAAAALSAEGVMDKFANSFLVEISSGECDKTIDYVKINSLRRERFRIMTVLGGGLSGAYKLPLTSAAKEHIAAMKKNEDIYPNGIKQLAASEYKDGLSYPFLKSRSLTDVILHSGRVIGGLKAFFGLFDTKKCNFESRGFSSVFGSTVCGRELECISPANIDLICDNIFVENDGYTVIDNEWVFDMPIPLGFIIWRCINELYYKNPVLEEKEKKADVFSAFDIDDDLCGVFTAWAVHFADVYAGQNYLLDYVCPLNEISLLELYNARLAEKNLLSSCYFDKGSGFNEEDKVFKTLELDDDGCFTAEFDIPDDVEKLRWDAAEGMFLKCRIDSVEGGRLTPDNAAKTDGGFDVFYTADPHYTVAEHSGRLVIHGCIKPIESDEILKVFEANAAAYSAEKNSLESLIVKQLQAIEEKDKALAAEGRYVRGCEDRLNEYFRKQVELNLAVERCQMQLDASRAENARITGSRAWRIMSALWRIKARLTNRGK